MSFKNIQLTILPLKGKFKVIKIAKAIVFQPKNKLGENFRRFFLFLHCQQPTKQAAMSMQKLMG